MAASKFAPLKAFVLRRAPMRVSLHGPLRDRLVEQIVEDWPVGCPPDRLEEVVSARMQVRLREQYGSVIAIFIISTIANILIRLVIEWWFSHHANRLLMAEWAETL